MTKIQNSKQEPGELHMTPMLKTFAGSRLRILEFLVAVLNI
jgi:hypothetical protein